MMSPSFCCSTDCPPGPNQRSLPCDNIVPPPSSIGVPSASAGSGNAGRAADHGFVGALGPAAAQIKGNEKVVIIAVVDDERRLYRLPIAGQTGRIRRRILGTLAAGERVQLCVCRRQKTGLGVNAPHLDAVPEAAKSKPGLALV